MKGYYFLTLGQGNMVRTKTWTVSTVVSLLSEVGGFAVSTVSILRLLFVSRTKYSYDISRLKRFFYHEKQDSENSNFEDSSGKLSE